MVGRSVSPIQASQVLGPGGPTQFVPTLGAASDVANLASHLPGRLDGATRSPRFAGTRSRSPVGLRHRPEVVNDRFREQPGRGAVAVDDGRRLPFRDQLIQALPVAELG